MYLADVAAAAIACATGKIWVGIKVASYLGDVERYDHHPVAADHDGRDHG